MDLSTESFSRIIIQWAELPCQDRNGEIRGYIVEYSSTSPLHSNTVPTLSNSTRVLLNGLLPRTNYILSVKAVGTLDLSGDAIANISTGIPSGQ